MKMTTRDIVKSGWLYHKDGAYTNKSIEYTIEPKRPFVYQVVKTLSFTTNHTYSRKKFLFLYEYKVISVDLSEKLYLYEEDGENYWASRRNIPSKLGWNPIEFKSIKEAEAYLAKHLEYEKEAKEFMSSKPVKVNI